ncbi:phage tail protein [Salmonella enterica]|nr:phage tail protein [Salmonella enterica]EIE5967867.1 phage tail protein [Salmonella enterica]
MTQSVITSAFDRLKAQEAAGGKRIIIDRFVFADIPGQSPDATPSADEAMPAADRIVHTQDVDKNGMVNENTVAYSVVLPESAGDFTFNWMGLVSSATNTLCMVVCLRPQQKIKTVSGVQGNVLVYSEIMEYAGAAAMTGITTPVSTWQIDFTARLHGMDEDTRRAALDIYGPGLFFDDAFKLTAKATGQATFAPGIAYLRGLRTELDREGTLTFLTGTAQTVYLDAALTGTLTGENRVTFSMTSKVTADYTDSQGFAHYVEPVATISASGDITDIRKTRKPLNDRLDGEFLARSKNLKEIADNGKDAQDDARRHLALGKLAIKDSLGPEDVNALAKDQNLNDVPDKAKARTALALGNSATRDVGTTAETVAAGDDSRITGAMQKDQNGADIPDKTLFVQNLDLTDTVNRASHVQASDGNIYGSCWGGWLNDYIRRNTPGMPSLDPYATTDWVNRYFANKSTASLATNGWFRDATTGFMIQWGTAPGGMGTFAVNLPQPFPRATLWVLGWVAGALNYGDDDWSNSAGIINNSQISVTTDHGWSTSWIAIGH